MNPIHIDFIGNYFLAKRYARTLDDNMTYLLNNYMVYGFLSFPEDLKDRFVIEVLMIIGHNLKQKNGQKLGLQACYAFVLAQSLLINTHENLTRSQVQDIVIAAIQVIQMDKKSETVLAACFTTINAALVFCPMITIQTLLQRDFFYNFLSVLNKKLVTVCQTYYDRRLLVLSLISLLRHTSESEELTKLNSSNVFRFLGMLLDYHRLLNNLQEDTTEMGPKEITEYGNLQKDIMALELVESEEDRFDDLMREEETQELRPADRHDHDDSEDLNHDEDSLYASDDSADFKNHDFDVQKVDEGKILQISREKARHSSESKRRI